MAGNRRRDVEVARELIDDRATRQARCKVDDRHMVLVPDGVQGVAEKQDAVAGNARSPHVDRRHILGRGVDPVQLAGRRVHRDQCLSVGRRVDAIQPEHVRLGRRKRGEVDLGDLAGAMIDAVDDAAE